MRRKDFLHILIFFGKAIDKDLKSKSITLLYKEYFSNDVLFATNFRANKPKSLFINTKLLNTIDEFYAYTLIKSINLGNYCSETTYSANFFVSIEENINLFVQQLKAASVKRIIAFNEYETLMHTFVSIDQKIERVKIEFRLQDAEKKHFAKLY